MKYLVVLFFFFGSLAFAGDFRGGGNAGGFGEMQVMLANRQIPSLLKSCLENPQLCSLNQDESASLKQAASNTFTIKLDASCSGPLFVIVSAKEAVLNACELYVKDSSPPIAKSFRELAVIALSARLVAVAGLPNLEALGLSDKALSSLTQNDQSLSIALAQGNFIAHVSTVTFLKTAKIFFALEGQKITIDITDLVTKSFPCTLSEIPTVEVTRMRALEGNAALFESSVTYTCENGGRWRGILQSYFETIDKEIVPASVQARIVERSRR
jgi:hypothetical protein